MEVDQGSEKRPRLQPAAPVTPDWMMGTLSRELKQVISEKNLLTVRTRKRVMEDMEATASEAEDAQMERLRAKAVQEVISRYVQVAFVLTQSHVYITMSVLQWPNSSVSYISAKSRTSDTWRSSKSFSCDLLKTLD